MLEHNGITSESIKYITDALKVNKTLKVLNLCKIYIIIGNNNMGIEGAKYISEALISNKSLSSIDISKN